MERVPDSALPPVKGKSLCTANFQNKSKALARVELVYFGSKVFPFRIDPILNMTTRIDVEKAWRKLPNPVFESSLHMHESSVIHGKVEYGYCEIRGLDDVEINVQKTAEFLSLQKWVGVIHMSDSSKVFVIPTSDLSQRLGLTHANHGPHVLHGLFTRKLKLPAQGDPPIQASENQSVKLSTKSKKHPKVAFGNSATTDSDNDCVIMEHSPARIFDVSSPKVRESVSEADMFDNQSTPDPCKSRANPSPLHGIDAIDQVAKSQVSKLSSTKKNTTAKPDLTKQSCSTPDDVIVVSSSIKPHWPKGSKSLKTPSALETSLCSSAAGTRPSTSAGTFDVSSVSGLNISSVSAGDAPSISLVCGTSISLVDTPKTSVYVTSISPFGAGEAPSTYTRSISSIEGENTCTSSVSGKGVTSIGGGNTPSTSVVCSASIFSVEGAPNVIPVGDQLPLTTVPALAGRGARGGMARGRGRGVGGRSTSRDSEREGKMLTRKRGKESLNAHDLTGNQEGASGIKKKKRAGKRTVDELPKSSGDGSLICMKVPNHVQLRDLVEVVPDIQTLEAEATFIIREELPVTIPPTDNAISLLFKKKPKKSCLSKTWAAAALQSSPSDAENITQPSVSGDSTTMVPCTPSLQSTSVEEMSTGTVAVKQIDEMEIEDPLENTLSQKTPKKVSLAEYKSRRRPTLDGSGRGKDTFQTSARFESESEPSPKDSPKGIVDIFSPISAGSPRVLGADIPISSVPTSVKIPELTVASVTSRTSSIPSTAVSAPVLPLSLLLQERSSVNTMGICLPAVFSSLPSGSPHIEPISISGTASSPCNAASPKERADKLKVSLQMQNSQLPPGMTVADTNTLLEAKTTSAYAESLPKAKTTMSCLIGKAAVTNAAIVRETDMVLQSSSLAVSNAVTAVDKICSTVTDISAPTIPTPINFTLKDVLTSQPSPDESTPTTFQCHKLPPENQLQNPCPSVSPLSFSHTSDSAASGLKPVDTVLKGPLSDFSRLQPSANAAEQGQVECHNRPHTPPFHSYSHPSSPPALLPVSDEPMIISSTPTRPSMSTHSLHSTAEDILLEPSTPFQSPPPLSPLCGSPSFHLTCASTPLSSTPRRGDSATDMSRSPELALELTSSPLSHHSAELTVLAEPQISDNPFSAPGPSTSPTVLPIDTKSTDLHQSIDRSESQATFHLDVSSDCSAGTTCVEKTPGTLETMLSTPRSTTVTSSSQSASVSFQSTAPAMYQGTYSICQTYPISQTPAFYLPSYYPVLPCVPTASSNVPYMYPWAGMYQYAAAPPVSSPRPPTQPPAWVVAQRALALQHHASQSTQVPNSSWYKSPPKFSNNGIEGESHKDVRLQNKGANLSTVSISSSVETTPLVSQTILDESLHKSTQTCAAQDVTVGCDGVETCVAAVQVQLQHQDVLVDTSVQTDDGRTFYSPGTEGASCTVISDVDEVVWRARQWLIHEIKYDAAAELETGDDYENSQGSLPSPVISGASNISDGDLVSNFAGSDCVYSPSKEDTITSQGPVDFPLSSDSLQHRRSSTPPMLLEFQSNEMDSTSAPLYATPPYTSYSTPPYTSYSTPPPPPCMVDSTPPPCTTDSTPPPYPCDSTPPLCPCDSTPLPCPSDSTPPLCPCDSTPPPCPSDSTPPPYPSDSTPPPYLSDSTPPPCPSDSTPPYTSYSTPPLTSYSTPPYVSCSTPPYGSCSTPPYTTYSTPPYTSCSTLPYTSCSTPPYTSCSTPPYTTYSTPPYTSCSTPPYTSCSTPPYTSCSTPPYTSCSTPPYTSCSTPPCNSCSTQLYTSDVIPPCSSDSAPQYNTSQSLEPTTIVVAIPGDSTNIQDCTPPQQLGSADHSISHTMCATPGTSSSGGRFQITATDPCYHSVNLTPSSVSSTVASGHIGSSSSCSYKSLSLVNPRVSDIDMPNTVNAPCGPQDLTTEPCTSHTMEAHSMTASASRVPGTFTDSFRFSECFKESKDINSASSCSTDIMFEQPHSLTKKNITEQQQKLSLQRSTPIDFAKVRSMSLPPLSSRASSSSGSPTPLSPNAIEDVSVFTYSAKLPQRASSLSPSVVQKFGDTPVPEKPRITMSAAEILAKVRAKRSRQPSLPILQEQRQLEQLPPSQTSQQDASERECRHIDLEQLMQKCHDHVEKKQKKKKRDKSWCHVGSGGIIQYPGWYNVYPTSATATLPSHLLLNCSYGVVPETTSVANSNKNNCEERLLPADCHNNSSKEAQLVSTYPKNKVSFSCSEYSAMTAPVALQQIAASTPGSLLPVQVVQSENASLTPCRSANVAKEVNSACGSRDAADLIQPLRSPGTPLTDEAPDGGVAVQGICRDMCANDEQLLSTEGVKLVEQHCSTSSCISCPTTDQDVCLLHAITDKAEEVGNEGCEDVGTEVVHVNEGSEEVGTEGVHVNEGCEEMGTGGVHVNEGSEGVGTRGVHVNEGSEEVGTGGVHVNEGSEEVSTGGVHVNEGSELVELGNCTGHDMDAFCAPASIELTDSSTVKTMSAFREPVVTSDDYEPVAMVFSPAHTSFPTALGIPTSFVSSSVHLSSLDTFSPDHKPTCHRSGDEECIVTERPLGGRQVEVVCGADAPMGFVADAESRGLGVKDCGSTIGIVSIRNTNVQSEGLALEFYPPAISSTYMASDNIEEQDAVRNTEPPKPVMLPKQLGPQDSDMASSQDCDMDFHLSSSRKRDDAVGAYSRDAKSLCHYDAKHHGQDSTTVPNVEGVKSHSGRSEVLVNQHSPQKDQQQTSSGHHSCERQQNTVRNIPPLFPQMWDQDGRSGNVSLHHPPMALLIPPDFAQNGLRLPQGSGGLASSHCSRQYGQRQLQPKSQDLGRQDHFVASRRLDHATSSQQRGGLSPHAQPLFINPHYSRGRGWFNRDGSRYPDGQHQRNTYSSSEENYTFNNEVSTFVNNYPNGVYRNQMLPDGRYPRSHFRNRP